MLSKIALALTLFLSGSILTYSYAKKNVYKPTVGGVKITTFKSDDEFINDAIGRINEIKSQFKDQGRIDRIAYTYELSGKYPIQTKAKVYFSEYRKPSKYLTGRININQSFLNKKIDKVIEVIYKTTDRDHIAVVGKSPKHTRLFCKTVSMPQETVNA